MGILKADINFIYVIDHNMNLDISLLICSVVRASDDTYPISAY